MKLALGKKFGPGSGEVSVGGGVHTETSTKETSSFENETFRTVVSSSKLIYPRLQLI